MSHLAPNTPSATAKLLRTLTNNLPNASSPPPPTETFTLATTETSESLLAALITVLTPTTPQPTLNNALQTVFNLSNSLPPSHLAPHWRTLCQKLIAISKHSPNPRALIALSSLFIASIPLSTLGTEQRAVVAAIAQQSLQHAQNKLSTYPIQSLCLIHSITRAAPRELRSQTFDEHLKSLFKHPNRRVRTLAAIIFALLVTCVTEKQQQGLFSQRVEYVLDQVADLARLLNAFTGSKYIGTMSEMTAMEICNHLESTCVLMVQLLDLPIRTVLPLDKVLSVFCDGIRERVIDPYAVVENIKISHDDLLFVIPYVQKLCAQAIADITQRLHKLTLQAFIKDIGIVFERRLSQLLLRSREDNGLTCVVERREIYETVGTIVANVGTGFFDFVVPRFQELVEIDVALHKKCLAGEKVLTVDPMSNIQSGGKSRKRRRQSGRRDVSAGGHVLTKESLQSLASVYGSDTASSVESTFNVALDVIARIFDCRGLLTTAVVKHLHKLEGILLQFLEEKRLTPALLRAATSAAVSGGSKRMTGEASPLLIPLTRVSVMAALDTRLPSETRAMALSARAGCEVIMHPRGPPYIQESPIYPTIVVTDRSVAKKQTLRNDCAKLPGKPSGELNGVLSNRNKSGALCAHDKETLMTEAQERISIEEAKEGDGNTVVSLNPENEPMEVENVAKVASLATKTNENTLENTKSNRESEMTEAVSIKKLENGRPPVDKSNQSIGEPGFSTPVAGTEGAEDEHQTGSVEGKDPKDPQDKHTEKEKESKKKTFLDGADVERAEIAKHEERRDRAEENKAPASQQPIGPEDPNICDEQDSEREDQALIDSLVFEPPDER